DVGEEVEALALTPPAARLARLDRVLGEGIARRFWHERMVTAARRRRREAPSGRVREPPRRGPGRSRPGRQMAHIDLREEIVRAARVFLGELQVTLRLGVGGAELRRFGHRRGGLLEVPRLEVLDPAVEVGLEEVLLHVLILRVLLAQVPK